MSGEGATRKEKKREDPELVAAAPSRLKGGGAS